MDKIRDLIKRKKLLIFLILMAGFFLFEFFSRLFFQIERPFFVDSSGLRHSLTTFDEKLHHRMKPNLKGKIISREYEHHFETNDLGFRCSDFHPSAMEQSYRIMSLGDNFAVGKGVENNQTYAEKLKQLLMEQVKMNVSVWNLGVPSYGTLQEIELFRTFSYLKPHLVIIGFFARDAFASTKGNDLVDNYKYFKFLNNKDGFSQSNSITRHEPLIRKVRSFFYHHLNSYRVFEFYLNDYLRKNYKPQDNVELKNEAWQITSQSLLEFDKALSHSGSKCILLWIPFLDTIAKQDDSIARKIESLGLQTIYIVSMLESMKKTPEQYYYALDNHWNEKAHALAAKQIYKKIIAENLLSTKSGL